MYRTDWERLDNQLEWSSKNLCRQKDFNMVGPMGVL